MRNPSWTADSLLQRPEDEWFDRKSFAVQPKDLAKAVVGFANAEGGTLALGIRDRKIEGMPTAKQLNTFRQIGFEYVEPSAHVRIETIDYSTDAGNPAQIVLLHISPDERVHSTLNGNCYMRVGDQTMELSFDQQLELRYSKGERQFDASPLNDCQWADLNSDAVDHFAAQIGASSGRTALEGRHLLSRDGEITVAAELLFGEVPQRYFPNSVVRVLQYDSINRNSGARQMLLKDIRFEGRLMDIIQTSVSTVRELLPQRKQLSPEGIFVWRPTLPEDAWLEGIVNAVLHRSYSIIGDHIRVELFPDRIEITSPGRFPGLADPRNPLGIARFARNPLIARAAIDLGIGQELGEGIRRIFDEMRLGGFADPEYKQTSGSVTLILRATARVDSVTMDSLPRHSLMVLQLLQDRGVPLGTGEIVELSGVNRPAVQKALKALEVAGLVRWIGTSPKDPRAAWAATNPLEV